MAARSRTNIELVLVNDLDPMTLEVMRKIAMDCQIFTSSVQAQTCPGILAKDTNT